MYFVDREKIEQILQFLEAQLPLLEQIDVNGGAPMQRALERVAVLWIDCVLDVGNAMIDGFIMRDPGSYEDIIEILLDEKVVTASVGEGLKKLISTRKGLVQEYLSLNHQELYKTLVESKDVVKQYPELVRSYLINELGPVSAFRN